MISSPQSMEDQVQALPALAGSVVFDLLRSVAEPHPFEAREFA
jgi:hypothetical protein